MQSRCQVGSWASAGTGAFLVFFSDVMDILRSLCYVVFICICLGWVGICVLSLTVCLPVFVVLLLFLFFGCVSPFFVYLPWTLLNNSRRYLYINISDIYL